jgi:uncharacterized membrane protein YbhN (UPF0104 family)
LDAGYWPPPGRALRSSFSTVPLAYSLDQIIAAVRTIPLSRLMRVGAFAAASYLCLTGFDWLARRYAGHPLAYRKASLASFTSLSLGHNIGFAALSSGALRYRFYSRWGLDAGEVAKVIVFSGATVGLGLMILGGIALLRSPQLAHELTGIGRFTIIGLGCTCLVLAAAYVMLAVWVRHPLRVRGWTWEMPRPQLALGQVVIGPINFTLVAASLHQAIAAVANIRHFGVAAIYVIANVTALISHVPGGLGIIESFAAAASGGPDWSTRCVPRYLFAAAAGARRHSVRRDRGRLAPGGVAYTRRGGTEGMEA